MDPVLRLESILAWGTLSWRGKVLVLAVIVVLAELAFRRFAPRSRVYARWTDFFQAIGSLWTGALLAVAYVLSVIPTGLALRLFGHDPLDRQLTPEATFWRSHDSNPLTPRVAARHQF
jgi:hypothetical protein